MQIESFFNLRKAFASFMPLLLCWVVNFSPARVLSIWPTYDEKQEKLQSLAARISEKQDAISDCVLCLDGLKKKLLFEQVAFLPTVRTTFLKSRLFSGAVCQEEIILMPDHQKQFLDEFAAYFFTLKKIIETLVVYDNAWKLYQGPEASYNAPMGSYKCFLLGARLFLRAYKFRRCDLAVQVFNLGAGAPQTEEGHLPKQEEGLLPIAQGVMEIAVVDFHPQLKERLEAFRTHAQETIHEQVRKQKTSGSLPVMNLLGDFLGFPDMQNFSIKNPFKNEYDKEYSLYSVFYQKFKEIKGKDSPESEKLLINMMRSYDRFWKSGILERAKNWKRANLPPMSAEEFRSAIAAIFRENPTENE